MGLAVILPPVNKRMYMANLSIFNKSAMFKKRTHSFLPVTALHTDDSSFLFTGIGKGDFPRRQ